MNARTVGAAGGKRIVVYSNHLATSRTVDVIPFGRDFVVVVRVCGRNSR